MFLGRIEESHKNIPQHTYNLKSRNAISTGSITITLPNANIFFERAFAFVALYQQRLALICCRNLAAHLLKVVRDILCRLVF